MKNHYISTFGQFALLKRSQYDLTFLITWILFPGVLQVTLQSQECVTQSAAAPSTTKTASPRPLLWLTRQDMCRFLLCSSSSRLCRYSSSTWSHELLFSRWHCVVEWEKWLSFCKIPQLHISSAKVFLGLFFFCPRSLCQVTRGTFKQIGLYRCHGKHASSYWILLFVYLAHAQKLKVSITVIISPLLFPILECISRIFHTSCNIFHLLQTTTPLFFNVSLSLCHNHTHTYTQIQQTSSRELKPVWIIIEGCKNLNTLRIRRKRILNNYVTA